MCPGHDSLPPSDAVVVIAPGIPLQARARAERARGRPGRASRWSAISSRPARKVSTQTWIKLGTVTTYPEGETRLAIYDNPFRVPWDGATAKVACWVRRIAAEQFQVFAINCAHLGCPVRWFAAVAPVHVSLPWRRLLRRRHARLGAAAAGPLRVRVPGAGRPALGARRPASHAVGARVKLGACPGCRDTLRKVSHWIEERAGIGAVVQPILAPSRPALDGELVVRLRQRDARPVHAPDRDGHLPGAGLRALGGRGLPEPAVPELPGAVRLVPAGHALLGLERDGRGDDAAHDPGLPLRRAQVSARDDLGRRLPALPVHARHGLHRPGPALGPGRVLGARHRRVDRRALAGDRRSGGARRCSGARSSPGGRCRASSPSTSSRSPGSSSR